MVEFYWKHIGYPISIITGWVVDSLPYSISSIVLNISLILSFNFILIFLRDYSLARKSPLLKIWFKILNPYKRSTLISSYFGLFLLIIQGFSQGITPYDFVPTKFRMAPLEKYQQQKASKTSQNLSHEANQYDSLSFDADYRVSAQIWKAYWDMKGERFYDALEPDSMLDHLNQIADRAIQYLEYPKGRKVQALKDMAGLNKLLGISFGGPAYHDVITGEVVLTSPNDYPISKIWRMKAILHEIIHAKGFTDEMMTEQLTWLALHLSSKPLDQAMSHYMFLAKTPGRIHHPPWLLNKMIQQSLKRHHLLKEKTFTYWTREVFNLLNIKVRTGQYGYVRDKKLIFKQHPWFQFVYLAKNYGR